jgi:hypothetical protein
MTLLTEPAIETSTNPRTYPTPGSPRWRPAKPLVHATIWGGSGACLYVHYLFYIIRARQASAFDSDISPLETARPTESGFLTIWGSLKGSLKKLSFEINAALSGFLGSPLWNRAFRRPPARWLFA